MENRPSAAEILDRAPAPPIQLREKLQHGSPAQQAMPPFNFDQARIALSVRLQTISGEISVIREILERSQAALHPNIVPFRQALSSALAAADPMYIGVGQAMACLRPALDPKPR